MATVFQVTHNAQQHGSQNLGYRLKNLPLPNTKSSFLYFKKRKSDSAKGRIPTK